MTKNDALKAKAVFVVNNDRGLHTRPATEIVKCASHFKSEITLIYHKQRANAKSLLGVLMLAAPKGAKISVEAIGTDSTDAVNAILQLAEVQFYMKY